MSPSLRILESWRKHAREGWEVERYRHYPQRIVNGYGQTLRTDWPQAELIQQKVNEMAKHTEAARRYGAWPPAHLWGGR